jgi:hypothetical protein
VAPAEFVPAKTVKEAIAVAETYADTVELPGITLTQINSINEGMLIASKFTKTLKVERLAWMGRKHPKARGMYNPIDRSISIRKPKRGDPLGRGHAEGIRDRIGPGRTWSMSTSSDNPIRTTTTHEMAHALDDSIPFFEERFSNAAARLDESIMKDFSLMGGASRKELFAEGLTGMAEGRDVPSSLRLVINNLLGE